jgi:tetratricopeptide (TPR) repeat protein
VADAAMTVVMDSKEQRLAAPRNLEFLPPSLIGRGEPVLRLADLTSAEQEPDDLHLNQARELAERHPSSPTAWARLAQAELVAGHREAASRAALSAIKRMEAIDRGAALAAAVVLVACDRRAEAEGALQQLSEAGAGERRGQGDSLLLLRAGLAVERGDHRTALALTSSIKSSEAEALRGWISLQNREYPRAIHYYRRAIRRGGPDPSILTNIGYAHAALGQRERAIKDTKYALSLNPGQRSRIGLNLVAYLMSEGKFEESVRLLRGLQEESPRELDLWFAEAHLWLAIGEAGNAQRVLRRVRTTDWAHLDELQQAEISANLAFVAWRLDRRSKQEAAGEIIAELSRIDFASARVAGMLPALLDRFSDAEQLNKVLARTHQANPEDPLFYLEVHAAVLGRCYGEAVKRSIAWTQTEPLNPLAAIAATYLLTDVSGDPEGAIEIGLPATRRMPASRPLANNVAYALAIAGRAEEASRLLPKDPTPQLTTTRALVALRLGDEDGAIDLYRQAHQLASASGDGELASLVALHAEMAIRCFGRPGLASELGLPAPTLTEDSSDQPRFEITLRMLKRLGVEPRLEGEVP